MITPTARARVMCCPLMTQSLISQTGSGESTVHTFAHMASTVNMLWWVLSRTHPNTHLPESARNLGCQIGHRERAIIASIWHPVPMAGCPPPPPPSPRRPPPPPPPCPVPPHRLHFVSLRHSSWGRITGSMPAASRRLPPEAQPEPIRFFFFFFFSFCWQTADDRKRL